MRVVITTMVWKRPDVFELWAKGVKRLQENFPDVEIIASMAGSEGERSRKMVERHGFDYIEFPNKPIGAKANARLQRCKHFNPDYVVLVGSDDLMSNDWFEFNLKQMEKGYDEIAPLDIYYFDTHTLSSHYTIGYIDHRKGEPIAAGRVVSRSLLEKVDYTLWSREENKWLDTWSKNKVDENKSSHLHYRNFDEDIVLCDVKGDVNMTRFKIRRNNIEMTNDVLFEKLPELCAEYSQ